MNYEQKYAPKTLKDVVFPDARAEQIIKRMVQNLEGKLIMFSPPGTGKTTCANLIPLEAFRAIHNDPSIDQAYYEHRTGNDINVAEMNNLRTMVSLANMSMFPRHVIVIDEADRMTTEAMSNLKVTIEKGGDRACWIMCTNDINNICEAVKSRSFVLDFSHFEDARLVQHVNKILKCEGKSLSHKIIQRLIRKSGGDIRKLNQFLQEIIESQEK